MPLRIEVGPKDIENKCARVVVRHNGEKQDMAIDGLGAVLKAKLDEIQAAMFEKAKATRDQHVAHVTEWKDFVPNLELNNLVMTPWCGGEHTDWEEWVKTESRKESLASRGEKTRKTLPPHLLRQRPCVSHSTSQNSRKAPSASPVVFRLPAGFSGDDPINLLNCTYEY